MTRRQKGGLVSGSSKKSFGFTQKKQKDDFSEFGTAERKKSEDDTGKQIEEIIRRHKKETQEKKREKYKTEKIKMKTKIPEEFRELYPKEAIKVKLPKSQEKAFKDVMKEIDSSEFAQSGQEYIDKTSTGESTEGGITTYDSDILLKLPKDSVKLSDMVYYVYDAMVDIRKRYKIDKQDMNAYDDATRKLADWVVRTKSKDGQRDAETRTGLIGKINQYRITDYPYLPQKIIVPKEVRVHAAEPVAYIEREYR